MLPLFAEHRIYISPSTAITSVRGEPLRDMAETKGRDASRNNVVVKVRFVMHFLLPLPISLFALRPYVLFLERDSNGRGEARDTALLIYAP